MKLIRSIVVMAVASAFGQMGYATTYYVATNGNDSASGTSWATAKATIQTAINAAVDGDTVLVSEGIYSGTGNRNLSINSKNISVVSEFGPKTTFIDCGNATRAVTFSGNMTNTWLIGFTIRNGYLNENRDWGDGGIIYIDTPAAPIIDRCIIVSNRIDCSFLTAQPGLITFRTTGTASLRNSLVINNLRVRVFDS